MLCPLLHEQTKIWATHLQSSYCPCGAPGLWFLHPNCCAPYFTVLWISFQQEAQGWSINTRDGVGGTDFLWPVSRACIATTVSHLRDQHCGAVTSIFIATIFGVEDTQSLWGCDFDFHCNNFCINNYYKLVGGGGKE